MPWQAVIFIRNAVTNVLAMILIKIVAEKPSRELSLVIQYGFCVIISAIYFVANGVNFHNLLTIAIAVGFVNGLACYFQWRANAISMSKTAAISIPDDIVSLSLAYVFLGETKFLDANLFLGVLFCLAAAMLFAFQRSKLEDGITNKENLQLIKWVVLYTVIWGVEVFLMRYFAIQAMALSEFLIAYYGGSGIAAICVLLIVKIKNKSCILMPTGKGVMSVALLATIIWSSQFLLYWSLQLAPLTVIKPINTVSDMIIPMFIGWIVFKEAKNLRPLEKLAFLLGGAGGITVALSFRF